MSDIERLVALMALADVDRGAHSQVALDRALRPAGEAKGARATELFYGVLRWQGALDAALQPLLSRRLAALEPVIRAALRLGAVEILHLGHPPYAVVSEVVEVAKGVAPRASGLVNAVLRRLAAGEVTQPSDPLEARSLEEGHPRWLFARWLQRWGEERTHALCAWDNTPPDLVVRVNARRGSRTDYLSTHPIADAIAPSGVPTAVAMPARPVRSLPGFAEGWVSVMGKAAQLAVLSIPVRPGDRVADVCAGRGTKTLFLLEREPDLEVVAMDIDASRLAAIAAEAARLGLPSPPTAVGDALKPPAELAGAFDTVLLDAPCTGLGTLRRHPEIRWRRMPGDVKEAGRRQAALLAAAATLVRPGGRLIYSVCSMEPEETEGVTQGFLSARNGMRPATVPGWDTASRLFTPDEDACEGFYVMHFTRD